MNKKILFTLMGSILTFSSSVYAATSGTTNVSVSLSGGALSITAPTVAASFPAVTLGTSNQTVSADLNSLSASDSTGTGNGWHVTVQASTFTEATPAGGFSGGTSAFTLPNGSLTLKSPSTITETDGGSSPNPTVSSSSPWTIDNNSAVTILSAATNTGMGSYNSDFPTSSLNLVLSPSTAKVDNINYPSTGTPYDSVLTWTIISGP